MKYIVFILFTVLTNAAAQLMLKQGMISLGPVSFTADTMIARIFQILFNPWVFAGLATFVISMASHLYVLSKVELSFAYPFLSLAYVAVAVFPALITPMVIWPDATGGAIDPARLIAAAAAFLIGWRFSVYGAIFAGMGTLYLMQFVLGAF